MRKLDPANLKGLHELYQNLLILKIKIFDKAYQDL